MSPVGVVILAAGASSRMGRPKQALPFQEGTLLTHTVSAAQQARCEPIIVVLGAFAEEVRMQIAGMPVVCVYNSDWQEGMNTSIRAGVEHILEHYHGVDSLVLLTCDQPFLTSAVIENLVRMRTVTGKSLIASAYASTVGIPALFGNSLFVALCALPAGAGAKSLIASHSQNDTEAVPFADGGVDIDTPDQYAQLICDTVSASKLGESNLSDNPGTGAN